MQEKLYQGVYEVVRQIPYGKVATYGQIAEIVGPPFHARMVGWALAALRHKPIDKPVPWQRVIDAQGKVSTGNYQRELLEKEGVIFDREGRTDFGRFGWEGPDPG